MAIFGYSAALWGPAWASLGLQEGRLSCDHRLKGNGCSGALPLLLPHWPPCLHGCLSPVLFLSKTKALAQQVFPLLNVYCRGSSTPADCLSLGQRQVHLGAGGGSWRFLQKPHQEHPHLLPKPQHTGTHYCTCTYIVHVRYKHIATDNSCINSHCFGWFCSKNSRIFQ